MQRLNTDRSIAPLVAQFVPLKIETDGESWGPWSRKYSHDGNSIPIIFVVRADGEKMYGKSGSLGDELPRFLAEQLLSSGKILSAAQLTQVQSAVDDATKARGAGDSFTAVKRLDSLKKIGPFGKLGSYAAAAVAADALAAELVQEGKAALATARETLAGNDQLAGALAVLSANRIYGAVPELKKELGTAERELRKDGSLKEVVVQAEAIDKALALISTKSGKKAAGEALARVAARFPGTPAAALAQEKIQELDASAPANKTDAETSQAAAKYRTWTDSTGAHQVEAELVEATDTVVKLKLKKDGQVVEVAIDKLSRKDQDFLKKQ